MILNYEASKGGTVTIDVSHGNGDLDCICGRKVESNATSGSYFIAYRPLNMAHFP